MKRASCLFLALLLALSCYLVLPVAATSPWCVNVLVAYDEEWKVTAYWRYAYSPITLARLILGEVSDIFEMEFNVRFRPIDYIFWDSDDNPENEDVMMDEAIDETGFETGMSCGYHTLDILVAFTDQDIPNGCYGYSDRVLGVVLVSETYLCIGQATDSVLQHELSHLYHATDKEQPRVVCVMNNWHIKIGLYARPIALTTNEWCVNCHETVSAHAHAWGRKCPLGGGSGIPWCPYGGDEFA